VKTGGNRGGRLRKVVSRHTHGEETCVDSFVDSVIVSILRKELLDHGSSGHIVERKET
jgi:hypothetical protein